MNGDISHATTALHSAAERGDMSACLSLIKCFALNNRTIDPIDARGNTPLHIAALKGHYAICQLLLSYGANPSARNFRRLIPFDLRQRGFNTDAEEALARALLPYGTTSDDSSSESDETLLDEPFRKIRQTEVEEEDFAVKTLRRNQYREPLRKHSY